MKMDSRNIPKWKVNKCLKYPFLKKIILSKWERSVIDYAIFRNHLCFFGQDMRDWTDEQIDDGLKELAGVMGKCELTSEEAARAASVLFVKDEENIAWQLSVKTPYTEDHINEFISLSGIDGPQLERLMIFFSKSGISNIKDVTTLVKIGLFNCDTADKMIFNNL